MQLLVTTCVQCFVLQFFRLQDKDVTFFHLDIDIYYSPYVPQIDNVHQADIFF